MKLVNASVFLVCMVWASGCSNDQRTAHHLQRAEQYSQEGRFEEAEIEFRNTLRLSPTNATALARLGCILYDQGKQVPAMAILVKAAQVDPGRIDVRLRLGYFYYQARQIPRARVEALFILERQPAHEEALILLADTAVETNGFQEVLLEFDRLRPQAEPSIGFQVGLGNMLLRQRNFKEAEAAFNRALLLGPRSAAVHAALGNLHATRGDRDQAQRHFETASSLALPRSQRRFALADYLRAIGEWDRAAALLEPITESIPDYLPAWLRLADLEFARNNYEACQKALSKVLAADATHLDAQLLQGRLFLIQGEADKALGAFDRIDSMFPNIPKIAFHRALALLAKGDVTGGQAQLDVALAGDPNLTEAALLRAEQYLRGGDASNAITLLNDVIQQQPRQWAAQLLLARAYQSQGNFNGAVDVYTRLSQMDTHSPQFPYRRAQILLLQGKNEAARADLRRALQINPLYLPALERLVDLDLSEKNPDLAFERVRNHAGLVSGERGIGLIHLITAKIHYAQGNDAEAELELKKALEIDQGLSTAQALLTQVYIRSGRQAEAIKELQTALGKNPRNPSALARLGMLQEARQEFDQARKTYETLTNLNPRAFVAYNNLAVLYADRFDDIPRAYQLALKAQELAPEDGVTLDTLGYVLIRQGQFQRALGLIQQSLVKIESEVPEALPEVRYHLGLIHYMLGQEGKAKEMFSLARDAQTGFRGAEEIPRKLAWLDADPLEAAPSMVAEWQTTHRDHPADPVVALRLGAVREKEGQWPQAAAIYRASHEANRECVSVLVRWAELAARQLKDPELAMDLSRKARALAPRDAAIAHTLGRLAFQAGDTQWALSLLQESARQNPNDPQLWSDLAWAQFSRGQIDPALASMKKAVQARAGEASPEAARQFITFLEAFNQPDQLIPLAGLIRQLLDDNPNHIPALYALGMLRERALAYDEAIHVYDRILHLLGYEGFHPAERRLAILLIDHAKEFERGYGLAVNARERYPRDATVAKVLGIANYERKEFNRAAQLLEESTRQLSNDAKAYFYLGMARHQLNQLEASSQALAKAIELDPNGSFAEEARRLLGQ